jgi:hypothetical protein
MDIKNDLTYRTHYYKRYETTGSNKYKYDEDGILIRCVPKILFNGNSFFVTFLQLIDLRLIMMFKYIDKIKRFKYITWY